MESPTARQVVARGPGSPRSHACRIPCGCGVGSITQLEPFHRWASVRWSWSVVVYQPAAVHADAVGQSTSARFVLPPTSLGLGVDWAVHTPPLRRTTSAPYPGATRP